MGWWLLVLICWQSAQSLLRVLGLGLALNGGGGGGGCQYVGSTHACPASCQQHPKIPACATQQAPLTHRGPIR